MDIRARTSDGLRQSGRRRWAQVEAEKKGIKPHFKNILSSNTVETRVCVSVCITAWQRVFEYEQMCVCEHTAYLYEWRMIHESKSSRMGRFSTCDQQYSTSHLSFQRDRKTYNSPIHTVIKQITERKQRDKVHFRWMIQLEWNEKKTIRFIHDKKLKIK